MSPIGRLLTTAAIAVPLMAPAAFAADTTTTHTTTTTTTSAARDHMAPDHMRASKLIGTKVYGPTDDTKVGDINDIIIDPTGKVVSVVVGVGGFLGVGEKNVALPMSDLHHGKDNRLVLNQTKEQLNTMASFDLSDRERTMRQANENRANDNRVGTAPMTPGGVVAPVQTGTGASSISRADAVRMVQERGYTDVNLRDDASTPAANDFVGTAKKDGKTFDIHVDATGKIVEK